jgi:hypothetical protein
MSPGGWLRRRCDAVPLSAARAGEEHRGCIRHRRPRSEDGHHGLGHQHAPRHHKAPGLAAGRGERPRRRRCAAPSAQAATGVACDGVARQRPHACAPGSRRCGGGSAWPALRSAGVGGAGLTASPRTSACHARGVQRKPPGLTCLDAASKCLDPVKRSTTCIRRPATARSSWRIGPPRRRSCCRRSHAAHANGRRPSPCSSRTCIAQPCRLDPAERPLAARTRGARPRAGHRQRRQALRVGQAGPRRRQLRRRPDLHAAQAPVGVAAVGPPRKVQRLGAPVPVISQEEERGSDVLKAAQARGPLGGRRGSAVTRLSSLGRATHGSATAPCQASSGRGAPRQTHYREFGADVANGEAMASTPRSSF